MTCSTGNQSSASLVQGLRNELSSLEKKLAQKKTFEQSIKRAASLVREAAVNEISASILPSVEAFFKRARALLRSRYTNAAFWATTEDAARASQVCARPKSF